MDPPKATGRKRVHPRGVLDGVIFRMRSGCHWNRLPRELGDDSTIHRTFQRWVELGVLERIWASLIEECAELGGVEWEWQAADSAMGKARLCLDKGYDNPTGHQAVAAHGYRGHVRRIGEENWTHKG